MVENGKWRMKNGEGVRKELKNEGIWEWRYEHILCKVNTLEVKLPQIPKSKI